MRFRAIHENIAKFALAATLVGGIGAPAIAVATGAGEATAAAPVCVNSTSMPSGSFPLKSGEAYTNGGPHSGYNSAADRFHIKRIQKKVGVKADGFYGPNTARKVAAWQKAKGLKADGRVGAGTWAKMRTVHCGYR